MVGTLERKPSHIDRLRELTHDLNVEETQLCSFFNNSSDLLAIIDVEGTFARVNGSWVKMLGWSGLNDSPWMHLVHPDDLVMVREAVGHLVTHDIHRFYCRMKHENGHYVVVEFSATKWLRGQSNLVGRVVPDLCLNCPDLSSRIKWSLNARSTTKQGA